MKERFFMASDNDNKTFLIRRIRSILGSLDYFQVIPMLALSIIGILFIYGTGQQVGGYAASSFWKKQILWFVIGFCFWIYLAFTDYRNFKHWSVVIYVMSLIALVIVLLFGLKIYGARRWLQVAGVRIQPSEFAKFAVLLMLSMIMSLKSFNENKLYNLFIIAAIAFVPFVLILVEPDLGSSLVIIPIVGALLFISRLKLKYMIIGGIIGAFLISAEILNEKYEMHPLLKGYQKERILVFLYPERDPENRGWNQRQSELAVGSGGLYGKGFMQGTQNTLGFLPQTVSNTDFIFSVIAEETGFTGALFIISMYALLIVAAIRTAALARDQFGMYLATGISAIFFMHSVVNIGMSVRLMPVTGLPLPLVSYGGSFMLSSMIYLGLLQSIYTHRRKTTA
jgi:rod shape determining protein RodA